MSLDTVIMLVVSALLLCYLAYALLRPEKFFLGEDRVSPMQTPHHRFHPCTKKNGREANLKGCHWKESQPRGSIEDSSIPEQNSDCRLRF